MIRKLFVGPVMLSYRVQWAISVAAVVATVAAIAAWMHAHDPATEMLLHVAWAGWVFAPPVWFLWEWHRFPGGAEFEGDERAPSFETLKYSQELASKVWAAGAGVLTFLHLSQPVLLRL